MMLFGSEWGWLARSALRATADQGRSCLYTVMAVADRSVLGSQT